MAIKRDKDTKAEISLPVRLQALLTKAFSYQAIKDQYDAVFKESKAEVAEYLNTTDEFTAELGKGFRCAEGVVAMKQTTTWKFDNDQILALITSGKVTVETIVSMASFKAGDLQAALGEKEFLKLAEKKVTESLALTGSSDFKASIVDKFKAYLPDAVPEAIEEQPVIAAPKAKEEPKAKAPKAAKVAPEDNMAKVKAAAARAKAMSGSVDDELDAILRS